MEPTKSKLPSEAIELYNLFIHGVIRRRAFMDGKHVTMFPPPETPAEDKGAANMT